MSKKKAWKKVSKWLLRRLAKALATPGPLGCTGMPGPPGPQGMRGLQGDPVRCRMGDEL